MADEFFATRERPLLERLEVGLADEGVRVIHAVPDTLGAAPAGGLQSRVVTYAPKTMALTRGLAVRRLARAMEEVTRAEGGDRVDVVHVFGGAVWGLAADLADEIDSDLAIEVWRTGLVKRASALRDAPEGHVLMAPDPAIERALVAAIGRDAPVRLAPWGAHAPPLDRAVLEESKAWAVVIVTSGVREAATRAALEGLAVLAALRPDLQIFIDSVAAARANIWANARRLNLLPKINLIQDLEGRRDLVLRADLMLLPDAQGEQRSIVLEAMTSGMIVVAAKDPGVSFLIDGRTAFLVPEDDARAWGVALSQLAQNPGRGLHLTRSAHEYVRTNRRASDHVRAVLAAYRWLTGNDAIPFAGTS